MDSHDWTSLITPVVAAVVAAAGVALHDFRAKRSAEAIRRRAVRDAAGLAGFAQSWLTIVKSLNPSQDIVDSAVIRANSWLDRAATITESVPPIQPRAKPHPVSYHPLLFCRLSSRLARFLRALFYILGAWFTVLAIAFPEVMWSPDVPTDRGTLIFAEITTALAVVALRLTAGAAESNYQRRLAERKETSGSTISSAQLLAEAALLPIATADGKSHTVETNAPTRG
jgi:hypothetical protein